MEGAMVSLVSVGQYTGLRRFFGNPLVGIIGAVASVGSLILARVFTFRASAIQNWNTSLILHPWYWLRRAGRYRSSSTIEGQSSLRNLGAKPEPPLSPQDYHPIRIPLTANRLASVCEA